MSQTSGGTTSDHRSVYWFINHFSPFLLPVLLLWPYLTLRSILLCFFSPADFSGLFIHFFFQFTPPAFLIFLLSTVISTGRPSMKTQCWRLRGAGSWNSSPPSSLSPKASSHLKVSATSEVRSQAPTKGVIFFLSIHVYPSVACVELLAPVTAALPVKAL